MPYIIIRTFEGLVRHDATERATMLCGRFARPFEVTEDPPEGAAPCAQCASLSRVTRRPSRWPDRAERDRAVAAHLIAGLTADACAQAMGVTKRTFVRYVRKARAAMGASNREEWFYLLGRADERAANGLAPVEDPATIQRPVPPPRPGDSAAATEGTSRPSRPTE